MTSPNPPPKRMQIANVVKGRIVKPVRLLVYGPAGVGKSTFAAAAPRPIFIGAEDGTSELDVERFPQPSAWSDVFDALHELMTVPHDYQTVVLDTLDWLEPMCWRHVCEHARDGKHHASIEDFGYNKGYTAALDLWRELLARLEELRDKRAISVVMLAHTTIRPFQNPEGENYDRYQMKLNPQAAMLVREWADAVFFAFYETYTHEQKNGKTKGVSTGARMLGTQYAAAYEAKNRYELPERIPLDWPSFADAMAQRRTALMQALEAELARAPADIQERVRKKLVTVASDDLTQIKRITIHLAARTTTATST